MSYIGSNLQIGDPTRTSAPLSDVQRFSGNASTTTFTLSRAVNFPTELEVFVENIQQEPIVAFNVSGNTLTFSESPPTGTNNIYVAYRQYVNNEVTLADGSVTYSKLANNIRLFTTDNFIPDGSTTTFTLSEAPADANTLFVMVDGMMQRAPVHYTTSGKTITFTSAPTASSNVHVRHLGFRTTSTITAFPANSSITQLTLQGNTTANGNVYVLNGNMGIGTSSPGAKLDVRGTSTFLISSTNPTAWVSVDSGLTTQSMYMQVNTTSSDTRLGSYTSHPLVFLTNNAERMRIDSTGNLLLGTTSANTAPTGYISAANTFGFKNRIINGAMVIDQRNAGASFTVPNANGYGSCDRWVSFAGATSTWTMQRVSSGLANFAYALQAGRNASSSSTSILYIGQVIETNNCQDLAGQSVTLSFYAKAGANFSASSSALTVELWTGSGTDQGWASLGNATWTSQASTISTSKVLTTTYQQFTSTATVPAGTNEIGIRFWYTGVGTAGANDWFQITGVQLEKGSTATSFDYRPYGTELALCQRYYWKGNLPIMRNFTGSSIAVQSSIGFPVTMRTTPSVSVDTGAVETAYPSAMSSYQNSIGSGAAYTPGNGYASAEL